MSFVAGRPPHTRNQRNPREPPPSRLRLPQKRQRTQGTADRASSLSVFLCGERKKRGAAGRPPPLPATAAVLERSLSTQAAMAAIAVAAPGAPGPSPATGTGGGGGAGATSTSSALTSLQSSPQLAGVMAIAGRLKDYGANAFAEVRAPVGQRRDWTSSPFLFSLSLRFRTDPPLAPLAHDATPIPRKTTNRPRQQHHRTAQAVGRGL